MKWRKLLLRIAIFLLLIPVLGLGLPFGGAYLYGRIQHRLHKDRAKDILCRYESRLTEYAQRPIVTKHPDDLPGVAAIAQEDGALLFCLPYDSANLWDWVPCGLLYTKNTSVIVKWRKLEHLQDDWYFYWDTN